MPRPKKLDHIEIWKDIQIVDQKKKEYPYSSVDIAKRYNTNKQTIDYIRKKYSRIKN